MTTSPPIGIHPPHCSHQHAFDSGNPAAERGTRLVMWLTLVTMVVEIGAGIGFNSMALLADGWHMSSHAVAIGLSALAYAMARRLVADPRFAFGTWKIEVLAGYSSALFLLGVAALMVTGSVERLLDPQPIRYAEAMAVGVLGLVVNLVSAFILGHAHHDHGHGHTHGHDHLHAEHEAHDGPGHHDDLNLRSAYLHVIADAATSVLAIAALAGGWWFGWNWLDPVMGVVGAVLVAVWAKGLIVETGKVLLDREMDHPVVEEIREVIAQHAAADGLRLTDLHVWRVGRGAWACALTLFTHNGALTADEVRRWLSVHEEIVHVTVELQRG
ncbi:CDF family Co(II)/Ni(II) efflux transporter DmeF [Hydrogenophaga sp. MI9]|uniref:CDF family Co(II)/Ni(II) efflux transporter DmeF n=1 Tax=Hydrogenophaga sp. MI9 TaxID=3453719 RepID=UPI003EEEAE39